MDYLNIAVAKGRIGRDTLDTFKKIGLGKSLDLDSRKLVFEDNENRVKFIYVKSLDVITYVENGVADLGIVGKDVILESDTDVYEIYDLGFGKCRFAIAGKKDQIIYSNNHILKVATKYPRITGEYFNKKGQEIKTIKLNGSVELAPLVGLSDAVVDIVETGNTLKANGLEIIEEMFNISARLICNRVSYRFKYDRIMGLLETLKGAEVKC